MKNKVILYSIVVLLSFNGYAQHYSHRNGLKNRYSKHKTPANKALGYLNSIEKANGSHPFVFSYERNVIQFGNSNEFLFTIGCLYDRNKSSEEYNKKYWKIEPFVKFYLNNNHQFNVYVTGSWLIGSQTAEASYKFDTCYLVYLWFAGSDRCKVDMAYHSAQTIYRDEDLV